MNDSIQAIFENGMLRPLTPLDLPENSIVELDVKDIGSQPIEDIEQWLAEFDDWMNNLDPNIPSLTNEQISRESIYKEQLDRQR